MMEKPGMEKPGMEKPGMEKPGTEKPGTEKPGTLFGGVLLVAGTSIGGGMLALPILTGIAGFVPSTLIFIACWFFMLCTGLLYLEACLWFKGDVNLISMSEKTLGKGGKAICWVLYLFLFYCLTIAYIVGGVSLLQTLLQPWLSLSNLPASLLFLACLIPFVYRGTAAVDRANKALMAGLILSYVGFVIFGFKYGKKENLQWSDWTLLPYAIPICLTSFGYQGVIPTLAKYLRYDVYKTRLSIICGSFIPLLIYIIWQALILGIVPLKGAHGLLAAKSAGLTAVHPLSFFIQEPRVFMLGRFFGFFALATSFLGVTLPLRDFLADGLSIQKDGKGKILLLSLLFIPSLIISLTYPAIFLAASNLAGGIGGAIILGLLPILIVFFGRYRQNYSSSYRLFGGKPLLACLFFCVLAELIWESYLLLF